MKQVLGALLVVLLISFGAFAQNPHFNTATDFIAIAGDEAGDLVAHWKEVGLGDNVLISYVLEAQGSATYACINKGGNHPSATNKETVNGPVSASGNFSSGKNGAITASLFAEEPSAGNFSCPGGQTLYLTAVSYSGVTLTDTTNSVAVALPDVTQTFCDVDTLTKTTVKNCIQP